MPEVQKQVNAHQGDFVMLNIAVDNKMDPVGFWKKGGYSWELGLDVDGGDTYQVRGVPMTLFIDRQGNISDRFDGAAGAEQWQAALAKILGGAA